MMNIEDVLKGHGIGIGGSNIKSIQSGTATMTTTSSINVSIGNIDISKSILLFDYYADENVPNRVNTRGEITSNTGITFTRQTNYSTTITIKWKVIEFNNVKSLQKGTALINSNGVSLASAQITINKVNLNKSLLFYSLDSSYTTNDANALYRNQVASEFLNDTTITITPRFSSNNNVNWQVIEFN